MKQLDKIKKNTILISIITIIILFFVLKDDFENIVLSFQKFDKKYIITAILSIVIVLPLLYFFVLPAHAKTRIDVFLNPNLDFFKIFVFFFSTDCIV